MAPIGAAGVAGMPASVSVGTAGNGDALPGTAGYGATQSSNPAGVAGAAGATLSPNPPGVAGAASTATSRGALVATMPIGTVTRAEVNSTAFRGLPFAASDVSLYQIRYSSIGVSGEPEELSALLAVPIGTASTPLVSYQHGTITRRSDAPSLVDPKAGTNSENADAWVGIVLASRGYTAVVPDYVGYGVSQAEHPFLHAASEASAVVDGLRATRLATPALGTNLTNKVFLVGYSQGGHATMAAHRSIEQDFASEFTVTGSVPMAGPVDLSGITLNQLLANGLSSVPYFVPFILVSYNHVYRYASSDAAIFQPEVNTTLPMLFDGNHSKEEIGLALLPKDTSPPKDPWLSVEPTFLAELRSGAAHPLRSALKENDVYDWTPKAPIRIYHCSGDSYVSPDNSKLAQATLTRNGGTVELIDPSPGADHLPCATPALLGALSWIDGLR